LVCEANRVCRPPPRPGKFGGLSKRNRHGELDLVTGASQQREQIFLKRFEEPPDGGRVALEFASAATDRIFVELMQRADELSYRLFHTMSRMERGECPEQRSSHIIFALTMRQTPRKRVEELACRLERV